MTSTLRPSFSSLLADSTLVGIMYRGAVEGGEWQGHTGEFDDLDEILVRLDLFCDCRRPCCSGRYTQLVEVALSDIMWIMQDDTCTYEDEGYAARVEADAQMRAEMRAGA